MVWLLLRLELRSAIGRGSRRIGGERESLKTRTRAVRTGSDGRLASG
jgi:hypothetical protein